MTNVVYLHKDKECIVRYVGSGARRRAFLNHAKSSRGKKYEDFVNINGKLTVEIVAENLSKVEAENLERLLYEKHIDSILNHRKPVSEIIINKELFIDLLYYDESSKTGLRWKVNVGGSNKTRMKAHSEAGTLNKDGYYQVRVNDRIYKNHRIIAVLHDMVINGMVIDHIDKIRSNNDINNLRVVTSQVNSHNLNTSSRNLSGVIGVHWHKSSRSWRVDWQENMKSKYKYFHPKRYNNSVEESFNAACDYRKKMEELYYFKMEKVNDKG